MREIAQAAIRAAAPAARAVVIPMAAGREGELRCDTFPQRPRRVRLTVSDPAARRSSKCHTLSHVPPWARGFPPFKMARLKW